MTKYEKFDLLEKAYKKIGEELDKAYSAWEAVLNEEKFDPQASKLCRGYCNGLAKAKEVIGEMELAILREEEK